MAQLAIKGHATRGKEVIEILEMLGGKNLYNYCADCDSLCFYIGKGTNIIYYDDANTWCEDEEIVFTLEEFLEKIPYKVGDKVLAFGNKWTIVDAVWDWSIEEVVYIIKSETSGYTTTKLSNQLQPYKEGAMDKAIKAVFDAKVQCCDIMNDIIKKDMKEIKIDIPAGYEFAGVDDDKQQVIFAKIRPEFPKTYKECFNICFGNHHPVVQVVGLDGLGNNKSLFERFIKLKICRDAYWKIAGEQMGLDKPWEPDWTNTNSNKYCIYYVGDEIKKQPMLEVHHFLAFPTSEMRDAFKEKFKELINQCKELL